LEIKSTLLGIYECVVSPQNTLGISGDCLELRETTRILIDLDGAQPMPEVMAGEGKADFIRTLREPTIKRLENQFLSDHFNGGKQERRLGRSAEQWSYARQVE
jgi:hypothetical protein